MATASRTYSHILFSVNKPEDAQLGGVVPSLEASSLETQLGFGIVGDAGSREASFDAVQGGMVQVGELLGVAKLAWWCSQLWWRPGVISRRRCGRGQRNAAAGVA